MGLLEISGYGNKQGSKTNFILSHSEMKPQVISTLKFMQSYRVLTPKQAQAIDEEISNAILRA